MDDDDLKRERANEFMDGVFSDFMSNNREDLMRDFCEDNEDDFNAYCREAFKEWGNNK
jgi:hypothetical protein